jgi:hypothetical protein
MKQIIVDREKVFKLYMDRVNQIAEDCDWVTHIEPQTLVGLVVDIIENEYLKRNSMKTFNDIVFKDNPMGSEFGIVSRTMFDNGYGVSVVKSEYTYGGSSGLYELAVLDSDGLITYDTPVTDDVIGYLEEGQVTDIMKKVQEL